MLGMRLRRNATTARVVNATALLVLTALVCGASARVVRAAAITQHPLPKSAGLVEGLYSGPAGLFIRAGSASHSGETIYDAISPTPTFAVKPGPLGTATAGLWTGPDGNLWYEVPVPLPPNAPPDTPRFVNFVDLTAGGPAVKATVPIGICCRVSFASVGGAMWIANDSGSLENYSAAGALTAVSAPFPIDGPIATAVEPDGSVWFTDLGQGDLFEITASGEMIQRPIADGDGFGSFGFDGPYGIAVGPDGALWFAEQNSGRIGRMTEAGAVQEYSIPAIASSPGVEAKRPAPRDIVAGPDGAMWFTDSSQQAIGRISLSGEVTEYPIVSKTPVTPEEIVSFGGELWFSENGIEALGSVNPSAPTPTATPAPTSPAKTSRAHISALLARALSAYTRSGGLHFLGKSRAVVASIPVPGPGVFEVRLVMSRAAREGYVVAHGRISLPAGRLQLDLTTAGKRLLHRSRSVTLTGMASFTPPGGLPVEVTRTLLIRR
jgi:streptogramin lyase